MNFWIPTALNRKNPIDNLDQWNNLLDEALRNKYHLRKWNECYCLHGFGTKLSSLEVIRKTAELVNALDLVPPIQFKYGSFLERLQGTFSILDTSLNKLNEKIEANYYSCLLGTLRKILSYIGFYHFANTQHALEIKTIQEKIFALKQKIDPEIVEQRQRIAEDQAQLVKDINEKRAYLKRYDRTFCISALDQMTVAYCKGLDKKINSLWTGKMIRKDELPFPELPKTDVLVFERTPIFDSLRDAFQINDLLDFRYDIPPSLKSVYLQKVKEAVEERMNFFQSTLKKYPVLKAVREEKWKTYGFEIEQIFKQAYQRIIGESDVRWEGGFQPQQLSENELTKPLKLSSEASKSARKELQEFALQYELASKLDKEKEIVKFYEKLKEANSSYITVYTDFLENKSNRTASLAAYIKNIQNLYTADAKIDVPAFLQQYLVIK